MRTALRKVAVKIAAERWRLKAKRALDDVEPSEVVLRLFSEMAQRVYSRNPWAIENETGFRWHKAGSIKRRNARPQRRMSRHDGSIYPEWWLLLATTCVEGFKDGQPRESRFQPDRTPEVHKRKHWQGEEEEEGRKSSDVVTCCGPIKTNHFCQHVRTSDSATIGRCQEPRTFFVARKQDIP
ncbi:hypothetical protein B0H19DRAFT_1242596 [Mycena capillaripes]|nr:hypothetical protein B0H19DRAFT_1242596 [Mycena capillaripes]